MSVFIAGSDTSFRRQSTSAPGDRENDCTCNECSNSALVAVSAASLLLIVTLTTVILTQCLLMLRMRKSKNVQNKNETCAKVITHTNIQKNVPVKPNDAYTLHMSPSAVEEATYETVK